jgi:hypothetical protein
MGDTAIRRHGDTAIRRYGDTAIRRYGDTAIRRYGDTAIRRYGDTAIRSSGTDDRLRRSPIFIATPTYQRSAPLGATSVRLKVRANSEVEVLIGQQH